jgi:hypothetical protein
MNKRTGTQPPQVLMQQLINDKVELQTKLDAANKELAKFKQQQPVAYRASAQLLSACAPGTARRLILT